MDIYGSGPHSDPIQAFATKNSLPVRKEKEKKGGKEEEKKRKREKEMNETKEREGYRQMVKIYELIKRKKLGRDEFIEVVAVVLIIQNKNAIDSSKESMHERTSSSDLWIIAWCLPY